MLILGTLTSGHARAILSLDDKELRIALSKRIIDVYKRQEILYTYDMIFSSVILPKNTLSRQPLQTQEQTNLYRLIYYYPLNYILRS